MVCGSHSRTRRRWASNGPHKPVKMQQLSRHLAQKLFAISARGAPSFVHQHSTFTQILESLGSSTLPHYLHSVCWLSPLRLIWALATRQSRLTPSIHSIHVKHGLAARVVATYIDVHGPMTASLAHPRLTSHPRRSTLTMLFKSLSPFYLV